METHILTKVDDQIFQVAFRNIQAVILPEMLRQSRVLFVVIVGCDPQLR